MRTNEVTVYSAGPEGFAEPTRNYMFQVYQPRLKSILKRVINPWELTTDEEVRAVFELPLGPNRDAAVLALYHEIGRRNAQGIIDSDCVIANLDDDDSGTGSEIGNGAAIGKTVFGIGTDYRRTESSLDPFVRFLIERSGGAIASELDDLEEILRVCAWTAPADQRAVKLNLRRIGDRPLVFFGGSMGYTEPTRWFWQDSLRNALSNCGVDVFSQQDLTHGKLLGARIAAAVELSDLVVVDLDRQEVPIGAAAIVGYAAGKGKRIIGYRSDFRATGEQGSKCNLQVVYFITESGGTIVKSQDELVSAVKKLGQETIAA